MNHKEWCKYLSDITVLLNYTTSETLGKAPVEIFLNKYNPVPIWEALGIPIGDERDQISYKDKLIVIRNRRGDIITKRNRKINESQNVRRDILEGDLVFF